jgi:E3 ubiquitin-protein ligase synoviolin
MAVLYLQAFVLALLIGKLMNKIFFGQLRAIEMEHLFEKSWYAITETCLAFTVFRDDFSPRFVTMFTLLLFLKCFHWLAEDRVDYMERSPIITTLFHLRMLSLICLLCMLDLNFVYTAYNHTLAKGASVQLVFGFEYAILFINILSTFIKYTLHTIDMQNTNSWENKGIYMLYGDLVLGFVRVLLYLIFMSLMIKIHTFPLFAIRPMYLSLRSFKKSLNDVIMSRRAIRNLNIMYPDVTPEQLRNYSDTICIICREEMTNEPTVPGAARNTTDSNQQIKKLPCDHIFHKSCLRSWFQRQQTCPTCRTSILRLNQNHTHAPPPQPQQQQQQQQQPPVLAGGSVPVAAPGQQPPIVNPFARTRNSSFAANPTGSTAQPAPLQPDLFSNLMFQQPFSMPPFSSMPPPLPPLNFSPSLSIEELAEMEGNERHNVEARIHCLRNISVLLNASMVQMSQYMNICAATSHLDNINQTKDSKVKIENDLKYVKDPNEPSNSTEIAKLPNLNLSKSSPNTEELIKKTTKNLDVAPSTSQNPSETTVKRTKNDISNETTSGPEESSSSSPDVRQRRLQHFQTSSPPPSS